MPRPGEQLPVMWRNILINSLLLYVPAWLGASVAGFTHESRDCGGAAEWQSGRVAEWRSGGVAEWHVSRSSLARRVSHGQSDSRFHRCFPHKQETYTIDDLSTSQKNSLLIFLYIHISFISILVVNFTSSKNN